MKLRSFALATIFVALAAITGCDPCTGVVSCEGEVQGRVSGRLVTYPERSGVSGVSVVVTPEGGGAAVSTSTDREGFWSASFPATGSSGAATRASITIGPVGESQGYTIPAVEIRTSSRRGETTDLGRWFATPYLRFVGEFHPRPGIDLTNAVVVVERTGGAMTSLASASVALAGQRFYVYGPTTALAPVVTRLTVRGPRLPRDFVRTNVGLAPVYRDTTPTLQGTFSIGSALNYVARIERRGLDTPLAGVRAVFRRTGGVATGRDSLVSTSTVDGLISLDLQPQGDGFVDGTLELTPPAPLARVTIPGIRLMTRDDDELRLAAVYRVGAQLRSAVALFERSSERPLVATEVEFRPRSGPLTTTLRGLTDADGRFGIVAAVNSTTPVRGDVVVFHLPPRAPETIPNILVVAAEDDVVRLAAFAGVGPSLLYVGALQDIATFAPISGGGIEFRRTGGVPVRETVFSSPLTAEGLFRLSPVPLADGEVVGDLTFRLSSPYRDTTFVGVRLSTFLDDGTRNAGIYRIRRP